MGIGDWGLGIGDWGLAQSPIPNPQNLSSNFFQSQNNQKIYYNSFKFIK
jgi:hypothetical protein